MGIDTSCKIGKLQLTTPIIAASGCFGYGTEYSEICDLKAFGAIVTKTITPQPRVGNSTPRIWETPNGGMLNSIGLANVGIDCYIKQKLPELKNYPTKIIVSIAGNTISEYGEMVEKLDASDVWAALEINISCPNVKEGGISFGTNTRMTQDLVKICREKTTRPIIVKLTPMATSLSEIAKVCEDNGADAVSLVNTYVGMAIDIYSLKPRIATITAGYSGPPIKPMALARVWEVVNAVSIPVIGMGGICCGEDAIEFFLAGATAIEIGTMIYVEPNIAKNILNDITHYCTLKNLVSTSQLAGLFLKTREFNTTCTISG
ncbi:MAG: dihydroorotate dehydrogenase [bacterium]|nr:dihydroorotate dehydrogenase [bacterium]